MKALPLVLLAASGSAFAPALAADPAMEVKALSPRALQAEKQERNVDRAALSAQEAAISRLGALLRKYRDHAQEPILLARLADLYSQRASMVFRISEGRSHDHYHRAMDETIGTLDRLIAKYPGFAEVPHAWYLRGKCYEELGRTDLATRDYLHLVTHFPELEETSPAYLSLAEFAITANNHPLAITYLKELEKRPEDPHYPFALYKLAWSYYNIKDTAHALAYAERQIRFYNDRPPAAGEETSDRALRENTLLDVPVFYFDGVEKKRDPYTVADALDYFREIEKGPLLGRMALRFAKLLRSRGMDAELLSWKNGFLAAESARPESLELLLITYEHQLNRRAYAEMVASAQDMIRLYQQKDRKREGFGRAQKLLLDTAEGLQTLIVKNKETEEARGLSLRLAAIYDSFTRITQENDPRIAQIHYNLAETLFAIRDFEGATASYRWVVEHPDGKHPEASRSVADAGLKAIAARYEVLRASKLLGGEVKAVAFLPPAPGAKPAEVKLDPVLAEWIGWVGEHEASHSDGPEAENFVFEANRALYAHGDLARAMARLERFALDRPGSKFAVPSASLVLDSAMAASDWERVFRLASAFAEVPAWKKGAFAQRLGEVAADSLYKQIEAKYAAKRFPETLKDADAFLARYPKSGRAPDCLALAGATALAAGEKPRAMDYYTKLIHTAGPGARSADALIARAALEEDQFLLERAASDYRAILGLPQKVEPAKLTALRRKTLALSWLAGDPAPLAALVAMPSICGGELEGECDKYAALQLLAKHPDLDEAAAVKAFNHSRRTSGAASVVWATYALLGARHLAFRDRNHSLRTIGAGYKELDGLTQFALLPILAETLGRAYAMNRVAMKDVAPLRAEERYITHRVDSIHEMENAATKLMELPWARIRAQVLGETAGLYLDLARGLEELPAPKSLAGAELSAYNDTIRKAVVPFEEKGQDIRAKAFDIASRFAVEEGVLGAIETPFFNENPTQARKLKAAAVAVRPGSLPLSRDYISELDKTRKPSAVAQAWAGALAAGRWPMVAYLLQDAKEKKLLPEAELGLIRAVSLAEAGARGEGLLELDEARKGLDPRLRLLATETLARSFAMSFFSEKAAALYKELELPVTAKVVEASVSSSR